MGKIGEFERQNRYLDANPSLPRIPIAILLSRCESLILRKLAILLAKFLSANLLPLSPLSQVSGHLYSNPHFHFRQETGSIKGQPLFNFRQRKDGNIATILVVANSYFWRP